MLSFVVIEEDFLILDRSCLFFEIFFIGFFCVFLRVWELLFGRMRVFLSFVSYAAGV